MKRIVLMLLAFGLAYTSSAQLLIGPKIGVNFATLRAIKVEGAEKEEFNDANGYKTGLHFGLALHKGFNQRIAFQTEFLFTQLGSKITVLDQEIKVNNSYLQVPAMVKVVFGEGDMNFFINAGPYIGFWTAQQIDDEDPGDFTAKDNRWDVGLNGGAGVSMKAGPGFVTVEGRYGFGLLSLSNDDDVTDVTNRAIGVSLSYLFGNPND